ncbi:hypothetical protein TRFO_24143 [Tritrichomonas foetus]|uniref:Uncharacterized protein n=1 Tax=Tritrichomonas foetus TaxID=1144522 RepID=A0A1J4KD64_9EUKA|nr:hypothetical protein TRFO_24143 [Tritrichomonas foetus]|eukprot:OHT07644.1 hypothetical protein TRFO_24143 [Tritrichomonas foetus]
MTFSLNLNEHPEILCLKKEAIESLPNNSLINEGKFTVDSKPLLNRFIHLYEGGKPTISNDEWFEVLDLVYAKAELRSTAQVFDVISKNIFDFTTIPQLIIRLRNRNESLIFISAEKLPDLIEYSAFQLLPISTISSIFESRRVVMPSQNQLVKFVVQLFHSSGIPAISFVHYINPTILPQPRIAELNKVFNEFNCSHLFPEYQLSIPNPRDIRKLTLQGIVMKSKQKKDENDFQNLQGEIEKEENKKNQIEKSIQALQDQENTIKKKIKQIDNDMQQLSLFMKRFTELKLEKQAHFENGRNAKEETKKYASKFANRADELEAFAQELITYDPSSSSSRFSQIEAELNNLNNENNENKEKIENFREINEKISFYLNQIEKYKYHINHLKQRK